MRALICGFTGTVLGGIETYVLNMNEHMSEDCVFDYILEQDYCVFQDRIEKRGGQVLYAPKIRRNPFAYFCGYWKILGEQRKKGTRVFYYQLFSMTKLFPAIMAKMRGYKVVLHAHNNGLQHASRSYVFVHNLGKYFSRLFGFTYFTNSQLSSDFMFGKGAKAELIYNAIDTEKFSFDMTVREKVRKEIGCGEKTVVGFVGRLVRQKNPIFMLKVYAEFLKLRPESELWIIGEGPLKEQMDLEIQNLDIYNNVKWLGRREDVNQLMQGMDLLLQPSLFEGLGIVLIEGQATGLPVIASSTVIPQEAIASDCIKMIPLSDTPKSWAEEGVKLIDNCKKGANRALVKILSHYDINIEAKRLEGILKRLN